MSSSEMPRLFQNLDRHAFAQRHKAQQQMLGADVGVVETIRLAGGELQRALGAGREIVGSVHRLAS